MDGCRGMGHFFLGRPALLSSTTVWWRITPLSPVGVPLSKNYFFICLFEANNIFATHTTSYLLSATKWNIAAANEIVVVVELSVGAYKGRACG